MTSPSRRPSLSTTATASRSMSWARASDSRSTTFLTFVARLGRDQRGGHDAAGLVLGVPEQLAQRQRRLGRDVPEHLGPDGQRQVAQRVDRLVGLHGGQQARRLDRVGLAQQLLEVVGLHLLERVGRLVGAEGGQQLAALVAAQVLEQVGQLAGAQPVQALVGGLEAHGLAPAASSADAVDSPKGWMAAQSITRSGVGAAASGAGRAGAAGWRSRRRRRPAGCGR